MDPKNNQALTSDVIAEKAVDLIHRQNTMTLATSNGASAWAAPVYYVYASRCFYFFSDPDSRHIREGMASVGCAAAIHAASTGWRDICGIQMSGKIERVSIGREAASAFKAYIKKYPFCKEFFSPGSLLNLETFVGKFNARMYKFIPDLVCYQDNRIKFGHREAIKLPGCE